MEQWKEVLTRVFGGKSRRKWKMVTFDIMCVDIGIKSAYLFDQWSCSKEEARSLLENLQKQQLIHNKLGILSVGLDLFVYSVQSCQHPILPIMPFIVDISLSLEQPVFLDRKMEQYLVTSEAFEKFCQFVKQTENDSLTSVSIPEFEIEVKNTINPPCLFGLALGYPFIYWFNREEGDDSCLSMHTLRLYKVKGREREGRDLINRNSCHSTKSLQNVKARHDLKLECGQFQETKDSFPAPASLDQRNVSSIPSEINQNAHFERQNQAEHQVNASCKNRSNTQSDRGFKDCCDGHIIFSFTVPESCHTQTAKDHVENWFSTWRSSLPWCSIFSDVWMEKSTIQPQAVCL